MKFFLFNNATNEIVVNEPEVMLVKEFSNLWEPTRNKTKKDPKGEKRTRAFRELAYIWLMCDWASPYADYSEQERHEECLKDAGLTEKEWADPTFREAVRKYRDLQNASRSLKLIKSTQQVVDKIIDYFDTIDLQERDPVTSKPVYKVKDVMAEMNTIPQLVEDLKQLEILYKKEQEQENGLMGNVEVGAYD